MAAVKIMFYITLFGGAGYGFLKLVEGNEEKLKKELEPSLANKSGEIKHFLAYTSYHISFIYLQH